MRVFTGTILILFLTIQCEKAENFDALTLFENKTGEYACYRIPAIINTSNGTLLAFAEDWTVVILEKLIFFFVEAMMAGKIGALKKLLQPIKIYKLGTLPQW